MVQHRWQSNVGVISRGMWAPTLSVVLLYTLHIKRWRLFFGYRGSGRKPMLIMHPKLRSRSPASDSPLSIPNILNIVFKCLETSYQVQLLRTSGPTFHHNIRRCLISACMFRMHIPVITFTGLSENFRVLGWLEYYINHTPGLATRPQRGWACTPTSKIL